MKKIINNKTLLAFLLSFILGSLIIIPNIIAGKGIYYLVNDFNLQQISFNMINNYSIKNIVLVRYIFLPLLSIKKDSFMILLIKFWILI